MANSLRGREKIRGEDDVWDLHVSVRGGRVLASLLDYLVKLDDLYFYKEITNSKFS